MAAVPQSFADMRFPLETGDELTLEQFEERYAQHPEIKKAELIEGVVYVASPVKKQHGDSHGDLMAWLGSYRASVADVRLGDNSTLRLRPSSEVQPDAHLRRESADSSKDDDDYVERAPELVAEVSGSSVSYDLHSKMEIYRRAGVQEYIVWRVYDAAIDWFELRDGKYERMEPDERGVIESKVFPGLRLDAAKMLAGDLAGVLAEQQR